MARLGQCYVLKLQSEKWYVGFTERGFDRIQDHIGKKGAAWTKKYRLVKPIPWLITIPGKTEATSKNKPNSDEDKLTLKWMEKYGIENVRGGSWYRVKMYPKPFRELELLISKTKTKTPVMKKNTATSKKQKATKKKMFCNRCGRESHNRPNCREGTTVDGVRITKTSWKYHPIPKSRGKAKTQRCQAKTQRGWGPRCKLNAPSGSKFCGHHRRSR